jgi:hypothetical protein
LFWWNSLKIRVWFGRKREGNREGGSVGKGGKGRGLWAKHPSSTSPPSRSRTGEGVDRGRPVEGRCPPATRCTATVGRWGKTKRSSRATDSASYLGRGRPVEAAPQRWAAAGNGGWGGGARGLRKQGESACGGARRGEALPAPIYRRGRGGSRRYFELRAPIAGNGGSGKIPAWTQAGGIRGRFGAV